MPEVLFMITLMSTLGMAIAPLFSKKRDVATYSWGGAILLFATSYGIRNDSFPTWEAPEWSTSPWWGLTTAACFVLGLVIVLNKPDQAQYVKE